MKSAQMLAVIQIRGLINVKQDIVNTLYTLNLRKKHTCTVIPDTPSNRAAAMKCKDYVTYGELDQDTYKMLIDKRGEKDESGNVKRYFHLSSPRKGFERKGIKNSFTKGGALGYRGDKINDLIRRMI